MIANDSFIGARHLVFFNYRILQYLDYAYIIEYNAEPL